MIKVNDFEKMNKYIDKYGIDEIFTKDMKPYMELFLFKKNEHICKETEKIEYVFFFVDGKAKVYTTLSNGKSLLLCFYEDFKILGDVEVVEPQSASTNVQVINDVYCIGISMKRAREYLINDAKFLRSICSSLSTKLNRNSKNSSINLLYPLENRLASYILATSKDIDSKNERKIQFHGNLTEIAELLGTSYRHLLRILKTFTSEQIIEKKGKYFEVINKDKLKELASDLYK